MTEWIMKKEGVYYTREGMIARCRECKHWWNAIPSDIKATGLEWRFCHAFNEMTPENGFCFKGERKDGDENGKVR